VAVRISSGAFAGEILIEDYIIEAGDLRRDSRVENRDANAAGVEPGISAL